MADRGKELKGQTLVVEGSRSGADTIVSKQAYNTAYCIEFAGEAKFGTLENAPFWYIEKFEYGAAYELENIKTAVNKIYVRPSSIDIDITTSAPNVDVILTDGIIEMIKIKDSIRLITPNNNVSGIIIAINKITKVLTVDVSGTTGAVNEVGAVIGNEDMLVTLNHPENKPFNKRIWSLRELYVYE